jgi:hypothetical protein
MKWVLLCLIAILSVSIWARNDIDLSSFNKEMVKNIQEVLDENPQLYETKDPIRKPASVEPAHKVTTENLDDFEEQATGPNEL